MIFRIKHRWYFALIAIGLGLPLSWKLGAWDYLTGNPNPLPHQIGLGILAGILSLGIDGVLHESFKRTLGERYIQRFNRHGRAVLGPMRWPEYIAGGAMAALVEEPLFRGVLVTAIDSPIIGVAASALVFAACHWLRLEFLPFWFWAMLEGFVFAVLLIATNSLLVPMIAHGIHDVVGYRVFQTLVREAGVKRSV